LRFETEKTIQNKAPLNVENIAPPGNRGVKKTIKYTIDV